MQCADEQALLVGKWGSIPPGTLKASELLCLRAKEAGVFTHQLPMLLVVDSRHSGLSWKELSIILQPSGRVDMVCTEKLEGSVIISLEGICMAYMTADAASICYSQYYSPTWYTFYICIYQKANILSYGILNF